MAKTIPNPPEETVADEPIVAPESPSNALAVFRAPKSAGTLAIPAHWDSDPNCGEYLSTMDESNPIDGKVVAAALAGRTTSGKNAMNKRLTVIGITMEPFRSKPNDQGEQFSKVGFHLHTAKETVFVAHHHAKKDVLAIVKRCGIPTRQHPVQVIIDPVPDANTYRVIAADLVE